MGFWMMPDIYYFILVLPALFFAMYAQSKVKSTFNKYSKYRNSQGHTGAQVARAILDNAGLNDVRVELVQGQLTDHYDPRAKVVRLSQSVHSQTSVAAIGVAAHETGHAIQHDHSYVPLTFRNTILPAANIGSKAAFPLAILGLILGNSSLLGFGIILFTAVVVFQLATLPVEFNASSRALNILENTRLLSIEELKPTKKVLNAAAMTYVASAAVGVANLLRLILLANSRRD